MNIKKYYKTYRVLPPDYFYFETADGGENTLSFYQSIKSDNNPDFHIFYSSDAINWFDLGSIYKRTIDTKLTLNYSGKIFLRASNSQWGQYDTLFNTTYYVCIDSQKNVNAGGNIMSLIYGNDFENKTDITQKYALAGIFKTIGPKLLNINNLKLPAIKLSNYCYQGMFFDCTSLTTAPVLPATTLGAYCYANMFAGCTSLTTAPALPAMEMKSYCYQFMFAGCTSLTTAPELPATTLASGCYWIMFRGCSSLNYIKADFLTTPTSSYLNSWVQNVSPTGTFVKNPDATWPNTFGANAIPTGWTVVTE